jgi:multidrug efflux pump subunit AcrA (membrane-fusion protein)
MKKSNIVYTGLVIATFVLLWGCGKPGDQGKNWQNKKDQATFFAVAVTDVVLGKLNNYIDLNGDVETQSSVDVYADTYGKLSKLFVHVGDRVSKDTVIAEVDPSRPGSTFVASPVRSPIDGTITLIPVQVGTTISQGVPIARMAATDLVQVSTDVAERFVARIRIGLDAILGFDAYPGSRFTAIVTEVSPVLDPTSRTLGVKLRLTVPDIRVKPGMFARIKIITESKTNIIKIPTDAIVKRFDDDIVFVVRESNESSTGFIAEKRTVKAGIDIDQKREITDGLKQGERIVVQGQTLLEDKAAVKVVATIPPLSTDDPVQ